MEDQHLTQMQFDAEDLIDRMMGNEALAKQIVGIFLEDVPRQLLALSEALGAEDSQKTGRIAHSIRGAAANAGGGALVALSRAIEEASGEGKLSEVRPLLVDLETRFSELRPELEKFCL